MNNRIKKIRQDLQLTQQEFANRLKTSRNNIAGYELGNRKPSEAAINNICREFNVNEHWLHTGEGEPYLPLPTDDVVATAAKLLGQKDPVFEAFIKTYSRLKKSDRELIYNIGIAFSKNLKEKEE